MPAQVRLCPSWMGKHHAGWQTCPMLLRANGIWIQTSLFTPCSSWLIVERRLKEYYVFHNFLCRVFDSLRDRFTFQWNKPTKHPSLIEGSTNSKWALTNLRGPIIYSTQQVSENPYSDYFNAGISTSILKGFSHKPLSYENFVFSYGSACVRNVFFIILCFHAWSAE
jgi:hypothetical protein